MNDLALGEGGPHHASLKFEGSMDPLLQLVHANHELITHTTNHMQRFSIQF